MFLSKRQKRQLFFDDLHTLSEGDHNPLTRQSLKGPFYYVLSVERVEFFSAMLFSGSEIRRASLPSLVTNLTGALSSASLLMLIILVSPHLKPACLYHLLKYHRLVQKMMKKACFQFLVEQVMM